MASPSQITANRANVLLFTGPATPETKSAFATMPSNTAFMPSDDPGTRGRTAAELFVGQQAEAGFWVRKSQSAKWGNLLR